MYMYSMKQQELLLDEDKHATIRWVSNSSTLHNNLDGFLPEDDRYGGDGDANANYKVYLQRSIETLQCDRHNYKQTIT